MVVSGESKGQEGTVLYVEAAKNRAVVEGLNMVSKHAKPSAANPQGGIDKKEAPIHVSNLMLKDPKDGHPTRIGFELKDGKKIRVSRGKKASGEEIK